MTDPTPTPDTLRAAAHAVVAAYRRSGTAAGADAMWQAVDDLRAALAASPAPTDSPPRLGVCTYEAAPHAMFNDCTDWRPAAVTAPREDEHGAPGSPERAAYIAGWDGGVKFALAAAAPAVERPYASLTDEQMHGDWSKAEERYEDGCDSDARDHEPYAPPAVERATPDPDTLAELLRATYLEHDHDTWHDTWHAMAHALIAAGVTLNPPTPEQGHTAP